MEKINEPICESTDIELIKEVLEGQDWAFAQLFERYKRFVIKIAANFFPYSHEVEDIVQNTFTQAYLSLSKFRGENQKSFPKWLSKIVHNVCLDLLRQKNRSLEKLQSELTIEESKWLTEHLADKRAGNEENRIIAVDLTNKLLSRLSVEDQWILKMLIVEQLSINDISEITNSSRALVKVRIYRARKKLWKIIEVIEQNK